MSQIASLRFLDGFVFHKQSAGSALEGDSNATYTSLRHKDQIKVPQRKNSSSCITYRLLYCPKMSDMDAFSNVPDHQKAEFLRHLQDTQLKDSLR